MSGFQELDIRKVNEIVDAAVEKGTPLAAITRRDGNWVNLRSRAVAADDKHLLIAQPVTDDDIPVEFASGERLSLSLKLKHHKHLCTVTVSGIRRFMLDDGTTMPVLAVCRPVRMQRIQRRVYCRVDVPGNRIVRASLWEGGADNEPSGPSADQPVWSGRIINLSGGGFLFRGSADAAPAFDVGETAGVHVSFGPGRESFRCDAQFRHAEVDDDQAVMGFQFLGLAQDPAGRKALELIAEKTREFQQAGRQNQRA